MGLESLDAVRQEGRLYGKKWNSDFGMPQINENQKMV
jgi:hypothetical protein